MLLLLSRLLLLLAYPSQNKNYQNTENHLTNLSISNLKRKLFQKKRNKENEKQIKLKRKKKRAPLQHHLVNSASRLYHILMIEGNIFIKFQYRSQLEQEDSQSIRNKNTQYIQKLIKNVSSDQGKIQPFGYSTFLTSHTS